MCNGACTSAMYKSCINTHMSSNGKRIKQNRVVHTKNITLLFYQYCIHNIFSSFCSDLKKYSLAIKKIQENITNS